MFVSRSTRDIAWRSRARCGRRRPRRRDSRTMASRRARPADRAGWRPRRRRTRSPEGADGVQPVAAHPRQLAEDARRRLQGIDGVVGPFSLFSAREPPELRLGHHPDAVTGGWPAPDLHQLQAPSFPAACWAFGRPRTITVVYVEGPCGRRPPRGSRPRRPRDAACARYRGRTGAHRAANAGRRSSSAAGGWRSAWIGGLALVALAPLPMQQ